jgi:hypothetical protein
MALQGAASIMATVAAVYTLFTIGIALAAP